MNLLKKGLKKEKYKKLAESKGLSLTQLIIKLLEDAI